MVVSSLVEPIFARRRTADNSNLLDDAKAFPYDLPMIAPTHLKSLQAVELAARTGSLAATAEILGITAAAAGQRVKTLEDFLGLELFRRGRSGIVPTAEMLEALPHLHTGFAAIEAAAAALDLQRRHDLTIAAEPDFAELWLAPRLALFRAGFPNIRLSINGEGDAPVRIGKPDCEIVFASPDSGEETDVLFHDLVLPLCSPGNAARTSTLSAATRLEGFPLLHVDFYKEDPAGLSWPHWFARHRLDRTAPERGMRYRRITAALDAVHASAGVALCGAALVDDRLESGDLSFAYPELPGQRTAHAFIARYRANPRSARHVDRFRVWLRDQAAETALKMEQLRV
jgi:LysR family glycine cleavage system transcriptional activator